MRIIIKLGSNALIKNNNINLDNISKIIHIVSNLKKENNEVLLVTSGAVGLGMNKLGLKRKPTSISLKQACAAVGQVSLMEAYEKYCNEFGFPCAQILVSHDDFERRNRMLNLSNTIDAIYNPTLPTTNIVDPKKLSLVLIAGVST